MKTFLPIAFATLLAAAPLHGASAETAVDRRLDAASDGTLDVNNVAGSIEVVGWDRNEVQVTGSLGDDVERLDFRRDGDRVIVAVVLRDDHRSVDDTRLTINAPRKNDVEVRCVSANLNVRGIEGEQELSSVSGGIDTEAFESAVSVNSVSGNVHIKGHGRALLTRVKAVSGGLLLSDLAGQVEGSSVSGSVELTAATLERVQLNSVSGHVSLHTGLGDDSRIEVTTTSGAVTLLFDGTGAADYELASFSGGIRNCFGPPVASSGRPGPGQQHHFTEGKSNARVRANTMSGSIEVCRR